MPQPSGFQLVKALEKIGFHDVPGGKGSHRKLSNGTRTVIVPTHRGAVPIGTLRRFSASQASVPTTSVSFCRPGRAREGLRRGVASPVVPR
jgi:predicted RNA binding protein YcfA (HicA-like mRNA interferase family)